MRGEVECICLFLGQMLCATDLINGKFAFAYRAADLSVADELDSETSLKGDVCQDAASPSTDEDN